MPVTVPDSAPLTLTTSEPLARALRSDYAQAQRQQGRAVWVVPPIYSLRRWCREQWLQTWPSGQLLHGVQELALWQRVIEADAASGALIGPAALARQARAAMRLAIQYQIDPDRAPRYTDEQHAFARWHREVRDQLGRQDWTCEAELPRIVAGLIHQGRLTPPRCIRFTGEWPAATPAEMAVLDALRSAGCETVPAATTRQQAQLRAWSCADDSTQFRALARELRDLLLPSRDSDQPPPRIIVACPDAGVRREPIEAHLRPVLAPWRSLPGAGTRPPPWRCTEGRSLDQQPLVAAALAICGLRLHDNRMDDLSRVLLASVLWSVSERARCAAADYRLRRQGGARFGLPALVDALAGEPQAQFRALLVEIGHLPKAALPSQWVTHFEARLAALGWPGRRPLASPEFQAREHWQAALSTLSAMDRQLGPVSHGEGLSWLREILSSHPFEPRSDSLQPIEILPLAQAAGLPADHLFIIDACDDILPAPRLRQPFLAIEALAEAGVPDATPALALDAARRMADVLAGSARHLTLSHVRCDERGAQKTPTTVFGADLEWREVRADEALTAAERTCRAGPLYALPDSDPVPAVRDPVAEGIFGGVAIFRDFVEAPFFAYCRYRLGIEPLPEPGPGLSASDQGRVIHAALESFWREIRSQDALKALADAQLLERIGEPLDHALAVQLPADRYGRRLRQLERARLLDVLRQWLQHERRREEPFEAIGFEHEVPLRFEGLDLTLRIDRVDRVSTVGGERLLILDYKTGRNADNKGWKSDSLTEPQLPLYATAATLGVLGITHVDGIAFGHIRDGHPALVPCTNWRLRLIGEEPFKHIQDWDAHLAAWRERLSAIARGFLAGEAGIDPEGDYERSFNAPLLGLLRDPP